jgi:nitroreductase
MSTAAARTWRTLYELLTGADLTDPRCPLAFTNRQDKSRYLGFTDTLTTPLRAALHDHAAGILGRLGISEPITWEPPASCCAGITLPGRDPGDIDLDAVTRLVVTGGTPPGTAAAQLGTTISHVRLALEKVLRPSPEWAPSTPPAAWQKWQDRARTLLTREFFNREYLIARKPLRQIEAETGIPSTHLSARARDHGIPLTSAWQPTPIDPQWLRDQYARRSYSDIAAELDVSVMTVIAAARRHGIASRPKGVHSRPDMITALGQDIPPDIRLAVEGSLHGWQRLHRFREAIACPSVSAAAQQIGVHPSALIHQFQRLERDIGAMLYHRSSPGHPMRPTDRGNALLQTLDQPAVRALPPQQRDASQPAGQDPPPC